VILAPCAGGVTFMGAAVDIGILRMIHRSCAWLSRRQSRKC